MGLVCYSWWSGFASDFDLKEKCVEAWPIREDKGWRVLNQS